MEGDDSSDEDEDEDAFVPSTDGTEDAKHADEDAARRRDRRERAYLRLMRGMNLSGGAVPSPPASGLDSESEEENEAMKSGDYGDYAWGRGDVFTRGPERLGPSGRRAAKRRPRRRASAASRRRASNPVCLGRAPSPRCFACSC